MQNQDSLIYGILPDVHFRYSAAEISYAVTAASNLHNLDDSNTQLLARAMLGAFFLADQIKEDTKVSLQIQFNEDSPIHSVLAYSDRQGRMKAVLRARPEEDVESSPVSEDYSGVLKVFRWKDGACIYQSVVPYMNKSFEENFQNYLNSSEQITCFVVLWIEKNDLHWDIRGLLFQSLPEAKEEDIQKIASLWEKINSEPREFLGRNIYNCLNKIGEVGRSAVQILEEGQPEFRCDCSENKIRELIQTLGKEEAMQIVDEVGLIEVTCEFCTSVYRFEREKVSELF
ncbi:Hsp33 family molecular chaperone HslO [Leptospira ellisii]|uniref:Hsp33 family molecular chaperone HslO n=1 Tax=Leptospira ellisii TaxID=2023197 RepID=A0A2N0BP10_9LEPT|nr:Hsp33 family molecular chaperone HslO [Leptospira ellisii]MDV6234044.1 Hsp33 family molecular chaperone HslO [Leptospira ellisii]PJZ94069.1 molecular chaperone Hsp33 [Leptospira ellisii]PKA05742.1 molecular chaperone Hsp33 [Leptospira ellisii]